MVFVSKEPGLFGGHIRLSILINGEEGVKQLSIF